MQYIQWYKMGHALCSMSCSQRLTTHLVSCCLHAFSTDNMFDSQMAYVLCSSYLWNNSLTCTDSPVLATLPILLPLHDILEGKVPWKQTCSKHCAIGESDRCLRVFVLDMLHSRFAASAGFLSVALGALFMSGSGLFISSFRRHIGPLFVDDLSVTQQVARVAPICAAYQVFDGIAGTSSGVLRCFQSFLHALQRSVLCQLQCTGAHFQESHRLGAYASAVLNDALVSCSGYS